MKASDLLVEMEKLRDNTKVVFLSRFFKTGPGEYGEGDVFWGINVPTIHKVARKYKDLPLSEVLKLIKHKVHEIRLCAVDILVHQYPKNPQKIYNAYLAHTKWINNWDLIDLSAEKVIGPFLEKNSKSNLYLLAKSRSVWERRIAIMSTFHYIKKGDCTETLRIANMLLYDKHDLIQKAVGWMLREVGKRCSQETEEEFLKKHYKTMPRTMLRYAIERFPKKKRKSYLTGTV